MPDKKLVSSKQSVDNKFETRSDGSVVKTITTTTVEQYDDGSTSTETSIKVVTDKSEATSNQKAISPQKIPSTDVEAYKQVPDKQSSLFSRLVNFRNTDEQQSASKTAVKDSGVKPLAPKNYISNPSGHDGFKGWKILSGESGWEIEKKPEGCDELPIPDQVYFGKNDKSCFVTSNYLSAKSYLVDFQKEGLPASTMASMLPLEIVCSQMYASRWDCGGSGRWHLTVLDGNKKILKEHEGEMEENHVGWKGVEKVFKFGTGDRKIVERIRYLEFTHEGQDLKCWAGNYGMKFARACVKVKSSRKI